MGLGNPKEVRDGSGDPPEGPGRVWGPFQMFKTGQEELRKVWDASGGPPGGQGLVGGHSQSSGMGRGTLPEVWNW